MPPPDQEVRGPQYQGKEAERDSCPADGNVELDEARNNHSCDFFFLTQHHTKGSPGGGIMRHGLLLIMRNSGSVSTFWKDFHFCTDQFHVQNDFIWFHFLSCALELSLR